MESTWALQDIPTQSGLSGIGSISGAYTDADISLVKGSDLWEIGDRRVNNVFQNPKSESDQFIAPGVQLAYSFGGPQIQVFLESDSEEIVTLETVQQLGVRKQFDSLGILSLGFVTSGLLAQQVWSDPYDATRARGDTDREFTGAQWRFGQKD